MDTRVQARLGSHTAASYWLEYLLDAARAMGCDLGDQLRQLGIREEQLRDPAGRILLRHEHELLLGALERTGDPLFGLHMGELIRPRFMGELGYASMSSATLEQAVELAIPFQHLTTEFASLRPCREADRLVLVWETPFPDMEAARHRVEAYFSAAVTFGRWMTGQPDATPMAVSFRHGPPGDTDEYQRVFGCPVRFHADEDALTVSAEMLALPLRDADAEVHRIMRMRVQQAMNRYLARDNLLNRVRFEIRDQFLQGPVSVESVAQALGMRDWSLRRRLREEGSDFTTLLNEERKVLAADWLRHTDRPATQIASDLGYSEQSAFNRAFRRWFGCSPLAYRAGRAGKA